MMGFVLLEESQGSLLPVPALRPPRTQEGDGRPQHRTILCGHPDLDLQPHNPEA